MEKIRQKGLQLINYSGIFVLPDGRKSKIFTSSSLAYLKRKLKIKVVQGLKISGATYANCLIMNKYEYIVDSYVLTAPNGEKWSKVMMPQETAVYKSR